MHRVSLPARAAGGDIGAIYARYVVHNYVCAPWLVRGQKTHRFRVSESEMRRLCVPLNVFGGATSFVPILGAVYVQDGLPSGCIPSAPGTEKTSRTVVRTVFMKSKPSTAMDMFCLPLSLCYHFWPDTVTPDSSECGLPSTALSEARDYFVSWPDIRGRFGSFSAYLLWLIDFIGGDAPAFTAVFFDELHKLERSSSSLRL